MAPIGDQDLWYLAEGSHRRPWRVLGAHPCGGEVEHGVRFGLWAPNASRVSVVGDFNGWSPGRDPLRRRGDGGVWEGCVAGVSPGDRYKFWLTDARDRELPLKADPYAFATELRPDTASVVAPPLPRPAPFDRSGLQGPDRPISIYELHPGSWRRHDGAGAPFLHWTELADALVPHVVDLGFTHVELMPVSEHPFDGSWGYQPTALYAPSARFGPPAGLVHLVDRLHAAGIGVLVDWVPGHFPLDAHGLARFDGTCLYEHADPRKGLHPDWGTAIYNYARPEVAGFLLGNACFWLECFGFDGLRIDAVASMLYLDYSREHGQWEPNRHGGNENLEAVAFLRAVNEAVHERYPGRVVIAEESTAWPGVTRPVASGGLGFDFKWNMGWMNDTLRHLARDPVHRHFHHDELTFSFSYAVSERFVLALSHDEVVHGKGSLVSRLPGDRWQRFATLRAYLGLMYAHPGKKLLFMGAELAQVAEWSHDRPLDWHLLHDPVHRGVYDTLCALNRLYRDRSALHRGDTVPDGFRWVSGADAEGSVIAFLRLDPDADRLVVAISHFTPLPRPGYRIGVPRAGRYRQIFSSDDEVFGGTGRDPAGTLASAPEPCHGFEYSIDLTLPPLATVWLEWAAA